GHRRDERHRIAERRRGRCGRGDGGGGRVLVDGLGEAIGRTGREQRVRPIVDREDGVGDAGQLRGSRGEGGGGDASAGITQRTAAQQVGGSYRPVVEVHRPRRLRGADVRRHGRREGYLVAEGRRVRHRVGDSRH